MKEEYELILTNDLMTGQLLYIEESLCILLYVIKCDEQIFTDDVVTWSLCLIRNGQIFLIIGIKNFLFTSVLHDN